MFLGATFTGGTLDLKTKHSIHLLFERLPGPGLTLLHLQGIFLPHSCRKTTISILKR